jgi:hypothetical protein
LPSRPIEKDAGALDGHGDNATQQWLGSSGLDRAWRAVPFSRFRAVANLILAQRAGGRCQLAPEQHQRGHDRRS